MKINYQFFAALVTLILLNSCSSMYMPNVPATPMFKEKGEGYVAGHINLKGNISGTAGVAVSEHIAVLGNGSFVDHGKVSNEHFKQWLAEGAVGYFTKMGKEKRQILELYAGYGIGSSQEIDQRAGVNGYEIVEDRYMDFDKIFVQLNYSSTRKRKINLFGGKKELNYGTAIRLSRVGMKNFTIDDVPALNEENYLIEPLFYTRLQLSKGWQIQYTNGFNIGLINNNYLKAGNSVFTLGFVYNFWK